ncbi:MAG: ABC transporter permease [Acidimicrobiales bacterium]
MPWRGRVRATVANQQLILLVVLVALLVFFGARNSRFFTTAEFSNLIIDFSGLILLAVAETYVIISGGIDLSVGSTVAIAGVVGAFAMETLASHHVGEVPLLLLGTLVCAGVGGAVGAVNAVLITRANLVPFVATLVTLSAGAGMALVFSRGADVGLNPAAISWSATGAWIFTWESMIVIAITVLLTLVLHFTAYGRYNFAIGSNSFAARAAGIDVKRHIASVYVIAGILAGLTGMFFYIRLGAGAPTSGIGDELNAIAAVVIGGVSLFGGVGLMYGTILGAMILTVVTDGLIFINIQPTWNQVVVGAIIALAVVLQSLRPGRHGASG